MTDALRPRAWRNATLALVVAALIAALGGCTGTASQRTPEQVRAQLRQLIPASVPDRAGWAADIQGAFAALEIDPSPQNLCAVLAVTEQESTYTANPAVPGLGRIAIAEIEARAARYKIPAFAVRGALQLESPNGETWQTRISRVRTEKELSDLFEEMIAKVPMGSRLLARANPVRTGGPMQVSIAFAEAHAKQRSYPYAVDGSIRREIFTRRGGMYFGIAHLLDYPASYEKPLFRFADFNAGRYASRNAAFQNAVAVATAFWNELGMTPAQIRDGLEDSRLSRFERGALYTGVFRIADRRNGKALPRATLPRIRLHSPKITRKLTTEWFATRVNRRYNRCMAKAKKG
jgi:Protein of unknown function (DUF1615)